jgi:hypothetical protein
MSLLSKKKRFFLYQVAQKYGNYPALLSLNFMFFTMNIDIKNITRKNLYKFIWKEKSHYALSLDNIYLHVNGLIVSSKRSPSRNSSFQVEIV